MGTRRVDLSFGKNAATCLQCINEIFAEQNNEGCKRTFCKLQKANVYFD